MPTDTTVERPLATTTKPAGVIRFWASIDLVVTSLFVLLPTAQLFIAALYTLNGTLGGNSVPPGFASIHWFFVSLAGVLGVLWALARIKAPSTFLGVADTIGRSVVALLIVFYVAAGGAPVAMYLFVFSELAGAAHQAWSIARTAA